MNRVFRSPATTVVASIGLVLACTAPAPLTFEEIARNREWTRADVQGLRVYTDVPPAEAERMLRRLSRLVDLLEQLGGAEQLSPSGPVEIVIFEHHWDYRGTTGMVGTLGFAGHREGRDIAALGADWDRDRVLFHEVAHVGLYLAGEPDYPHWYHEGLAEFLSATTIREDVAQLGQVPQDRWHTIQFNPPLELGDLLSDDPKNAERFYADSFAFVHFGLLGNEGRHGEAFNRFVGLVRHGVPWETALPASFERSVAEVESDYRAHRLKLTRDRGQRQVTVMLPESIPEFSLETAAPDEVVEVLERLRPERSAEDEGPESDAARYPSP